jgi:hypothetical protein
MTDFRSFGLAQDKFWISDWGNTDKGEGSDHRGTMNKIVVLLMIVLASIFQYKFVFAASAPVKVVVTYGGLNERSGVLFVAKDAGIF